MGVLFRVSLIWSLLVALGEGAIHANPRNGDLSRQQPTVVEVDLQKQNLASVLEAARNEQSEGVRQRRQTQNSTTPPGFGTTVVLENDPHNFALVHWSGQPKQRIFILTRKRDSDGYSTESFLYISKDYGKSFENVTGKFPNGTVLEWYWISSNADILIFSDRIHRQLYVTMDEGDTFNGYGLHFGQQDRNTFRFQYTRIPNVTNHERYVLGYDSAAQSLWVTNNVNDSNGWHKLSDNVTRYAWRELNSTIENPTTVYFDKKINNTAAQLYFAYFKMNKWTSNSLFSPSLGIFSPGSFVLSYQYMFVQKNYTDIGLNPHIEYQSPLWVSTYRGSFNQARFPLEVEEKHYATVDASENQVFIAVYHSGDSLNGTAVTNMYLSEEAGLNYSLSLENVVSADESDWEAGYPTFDVYVVEALVGTYIANRETASGNDYTVISFDKGGEWKLVTPPTRDAHGAPIICNLPCSLHLHMYLDQDNGFQPILSQESAPGVLMALGNTGTRLTRTTSGLRLYMSTNGGVSWSEVDSGYEEFQLLDFGVFIAYTDKNRLTSTVRWSCTDGAEWDKYTYINSSIFVVRMLTEVGEKAQHATVFGYKPFNFNFEWLVIDLDFSTLNLSNCTSSDYYPWQPTDERSEQQCILGENFVYERRLPDHCCAIDALYERPVNRTPCFCTAEDFECDFGFERNDLNGPCAPQPDFLYPPFVPTDCPEGETYSYTSGYRKISGDQCIPGNDTTFDPIVKPCPVMAPLDLVITTSKDLYHVGPVDLTLTQGQGATTVTQYTWDFGDDSVVQQLVGLDQAKSVTHNYSAPGTYTVTMTATDNGGQAVAQKQVKVLDTITSLTLPVSSAFVSTDVILYVNISTQFGTQMLGSVHYVWTVNDSLIRSGYDLSSFTHSFSTVGEALVKVEVTNTLDTLYQSVTMLIIDVPTLTLGVSLTGDELASSNDYVPAYVKVYLSVESNVAEFPTGTRFRWNVKSVGGNGTVLFSILTQNTSISLTFPSVGQYLVTVTGTSRTVSFSLNQMVTAEEPLGEMNVTGLSPGYRINSNVTVTIRLLSIDSLTYSGNVWLTTCLSNSDVTCRSPLVSLPLQLEGGQDTISFTLISEGTFTLIAICENEVSDVNSTLPVFVADSSDYQYLRLIFNTSFLPPEYSSKAWQLALQQTITDTLYKDLSLYPWQVEVEVSEEEDTTSSATKRKRQSSSSETILVAHVYLLPISLSADDISAMEPVADQLVQQGQSGQLSFVVNNQTVAVSTADTGPEILIVDNVEPDSTSYLPLVIGLSVGGFVAILILVVLVVFAIVYWKKKYRKLEVRYTRLRQGPMRFTFTAEGETLEEEDYPNSDEEADNDDDDDGEGDTYKMTAKND